ncbi:hypothetical protein D3Z51_18775 [Clostridiaceae bacterium]|nr:hypothetical protein [Clostridiaceae bacterium]RKI08797.1 hypothetical protein D7V81_18500 [bacterium 1XD21-70]
MLVRVFGTEGGGSYGEVIYWNLLRPVPFKGFPELLRRIDGIADCLGFLWKRTHLAARVLTGGRRQGTLSGIPKDNTNQAEGKGRLLPGASIFLQCLGTYGYIGRNQ